MCLYCVYSPVLGILVLGNCLLHPKREISYLMLYIHIFGIKCQLKSGTSSSFVRTNTSLANLYSIINRRKLLKFSPFKGIQPSVSSLPSYFVFVCLSTASFYRLEAKTCCSLAVVVCFRGCVVLTLLADIKIWLQFIWLAFHAGFHMQIHRNFSYLLFILRIILVASIYQFSRTETWNSILSWGFQLHVNSSKLHMIEFCGMCKQNMEGQGFDGGHAFDWLFCVF